MEIHIGSWLAGIALGVAFGMRLYQLLIAWVIDRIPECKKDLYEYEVIKGEAGVKRALRRKE